MNFKNLLASYGSAIVDDSDVYLIGGITAKDLNYDDISVVARFTYADAGSGEEVTRTFEATSESVYTTLLSAKADTDPYGIATVDEATASTQGSAYTEGLRYITGMVIHGVPQGTYNVEITVYARTPDVSGTPIVVCGDTVTTAVTVS